MARYVSYTNTSSQTLLVSEEHGLYGSSRLGMARLRETLFLAGVYSPTWCGTSSARRELGNKHYELSNHLGNVLLSVTDKKAYKTLSGNLYFEAEISTISDYYPFGSAMQTRAYSAVGYRWGFGGQELEHAISGEGNHYTAMFWEMDPRLGRRWNQDPKPNAALSNYTIYGNNPILNIDISGDTSITYTWTYWSFKLDNPAVSKERGTDELIQTKYTATFIKDAQGITHITETVNSTSIKIYSDGRMSNIQTNTHQKKWRGRIDNSFFSGSKLNTLSYIPINAENERIKHSKLLADEFNLGAKRDWFSQMDDDFWKVFGRIKKGREENHGISGRIAIARRRYKENETFEGAADMAVSIGAAGISRIVGNIKTTLEIGSLILSTPGEPNPEYRQLESYTIEHGK